MKFGLVSLLFSVASADIYGNSVSFWNVTGNSTYAKVDLTRNNHTAATTIRTTKGEITINPAKTAMLVVDMQNYFLHPNYTDFPAGLFTVDPVLNSIKTFREIGSKIMWVQWGLSEEDLFDIPPSYKYSFGAKGTSRSNDTSVGSEIGPVNTTEGVVQAGKKLVVDQWNTEPYGPLNATMHEGIANGTDVYFPKNRQSGMWGAETPLGWYLKNSGFTTVFITGVNIDQCVLGTMNDAYYKGYDFVVISDGTATSSPSYAYDTVIYEAGIHGFVTNSTQVVNHH